MDKTLLLLTFLICKIYFVKLSKNKILPPTVPKIIFFFPKDTSKHEKTKSLLNIC
jgi:hypothetical protein